MKRRTLVTSFSLAMLGLSGCTAFDDAQSQTGNTRLQSLQVANRTDQRYRVNVLVFYEDELQTWTSVDAGPMDEDSGEAGGGQVESTWPDEPGQFTVHARIDGKGSWQTLDLSEATGAECSPVVASIDDRGLRLWAGQSCPEEE